MSQGKYDHCKLMIPVRHKKKGPPFNPIFEAPSDFSEKSIELRRLDSELDRYVLRASDYFNIIADAWAVNIHRSIHMEGNPLSLQQVRQVTKESLRNRNAKTLDWPRQEVVNHVAVHLDPSLWAPPWTMERVLSLHRYLLDGDPESSIPGRFRDFHGAIYDEYGEESMITCPPEHISSELGELLDWRNRRSSVLCPVVAASIFFHEFESIHPFVDGNGRTGRVLFHIYLQTQGLPNSHLCFIEEELMKNLETYYTLLAWTDQSGSYTELVDYFTDSVLQSYRIASERLSEKNLLSSDLDEVSKRVLTKAKQEGEWFSIDQAQKWATGVTNQTIGRHLSELIDMDVIESVGATRSRRYRFKDPLRLSKESMEVSFASPVSIVGSKTEQRAIGSQTR